MPTQWRTIAPLVGRTAAQCLERYEYLLYVTLLIILLSLQMELGLYLETLENGADRFIDKFSSFAYLLFSMNIVQ